MKILQINNVYGTGSTGKITMDLHRELLTRGHQSLVLYGRGFAEKEPFVRKLCPDWYARANGLRAWAVGLPYGGCDWSTRRLIRAIARENPDVVHLQCINGNFCNFFQLLQFLKENKIPTVLTLHAEFPYTGGCSHAGDCTRWITGCNACPQRSWRTCLYRDRTAEVWERLRQIYAGWEDLRIVGCSEWISNRAAQAGVLTGAKICTIHNGIDTQLFSPRQYGRAQIYRELALSPLRKLILYVAPAFSTQKGFDLFEKLVQDSVGLPLYFLAVGQTARCQYPNLTVAGRVERQDILADLYSAASALVVCSRQDTFPTVCLEAISSGTPVIGFDVGGVRETISPGMGTTVPLGDIPAMQQALLDLPATPDPELLARARVSCSKERMADMYIALYRSLLEERSSRENSKQPETMGSAASSAAVPLRP